jgi:predicted metal-dependent phosphoesterase TrpH
MSHETLKIDMHVHSSVYSVDSILRLGDMFKKFKQTGIVPIVCDHNSIQGSIDFGKMLKQYDPDYPIIYSEEIETVDGEIIGMFISEQIKSGMSVEETLDCIHEQGGIAIVPHPFDNRRSTVLKPHIRDKFINSIDFIEGYNARNIHPDHNIRAINYALDHGKMVTCGTDSHTYHEFGKTHVEMPWFTDKKDFVTKFKSAQIHYYPAHKFVHVISKSLKICRRLRLM